MCSYATIFSSSKGALFHRRNVSFHILFSSFVCVFCDKISRSSRDVMAV